jgi:hypothetical protein
MANMRVAKFLVPLLTVIALAVVIDAYVAQIPNSPAASEKSTNQARVAEPEKENRIRNKLAELLSGVGVHVGKALPIADGITYRELRVRWQSSGTATQTGSVNLLQSPTAGVLTAVASTNKNGALPRQRSFELSTNQILVIGLDRNAELRCWQLMLDPRLVRSETPVVTGETRGEEYYLPNVDFVITYPDDPEIQELRVYRPLWTGKNFQLELISTLAVD